MIRSIRRRRPLDDAEPGDSRGSPATLPEGLRRPLSTPDAALVALQRLAGNQAVVDALRSTAAGDALARRSVQREPPGEPGVDEDEGDIVVYDEGPADERKRGVVTDIAGAEEADLPGLEAEASEVPARLAELEAELASLRGARDRESKARRRQLKRELSDVKAVVKGRRARLKVTRAAVMGGHSKALREHLDRAGTKPRDWYANLIPSATFLGVEITPNRREFASLGLGGVHLEMYRRLYKAERELTAELAMGPAEAGKALGLRRVSGLRMPDKNSEGADLHSFGLAVDINADRSNPYLQATKSSASGLKWEAIRRASLLVTGTVHDLAKTPPKGTGASAIDKRVSQAEQMFDLIEAVAGSLETYFAFRDATEVAAGGTTLQLETLAERFGAATGTPPLSTAEWQSRIKDDYAILQAAYTERRDPAKASALIDLDKRLVLALVRAGLAWGMYTKSKDIMHFDVRDSVIPYQRPNPNWH